MMARKPATKIAADCFRRQAAEKRRKELNNLAYWVALLVFAIYSQPIIAWVDSVLTWIYTLGGRI